MLYFIEENIKMILIGLIISLIGSYFVYDFYFTKKTIDTNSQINKQEIILEQNKQEIILKLKNYDLNNENNALDKDNKSLINKYDSYQVYIYPSAFSLKCTSSNIDICKNIEEKSELIKKYSIGFMGGDFRIGEDFKLDLDSFFSKEINGDYLLKDFFNGLYLLDTGKNSFSGYEKYFDFKKNNNEDEITINSMEKACVDGIKNSMVQGTFDEENIIYNSVKSQCTGLGDLSGEDVFLKNEFNEKQQDISLTVEISELLVSYKFFKKIGLEFLEKDHKNINVKKNIKLISEIKLPYFK